MRTTVADDHRGPIRNTALATVPGVVSQVLSDSGSADVTVRAAVLATTGANVAGLVLLALLLVGGGALLRRRRPRAAHRA